MIQEPGQHERRARRGRTAVGHVRRQRRGVALLLSLFVMLLASLVVVGALDATTSRMSAMHHSADYERALYLAGAGVHEVLANLESDSGWRGTLGPTEFPAGSGDTFTATAADGTDSDIVVTGSGTSGGFTRKLQVAVDTGS